MVAVTGVQATVMAAAAVDNDGAHPQWPGRRATRTATTETATEGAMASGAETMARETTANTKDRASKLTGRG
jgi:hypothetical protein